MNPDSVSFVLNGKDVTASAEAGAFLLDLVRELGMTGAKEGCGEGECGSCTVMLDGVAVRSCIVFAHAAAGSRVETVESLGAAGSLHPLQQAFHHQAAVQCGYCTPGLLMQAKALLEENPDPSADEIRSALSGNICRCTGYQSIVAAVQAAAAQLRAKRP
jgi:carbon-monoxide dehydrogenase small subunit